MPFQILNQDTPEPENQPASINNRIALLLQTHVLVLVYRWFAWIGAGVLILFFSETLNAQPYYIWLLGLTGFLNIALTLLIHPYIRSLQQPVLLLPDILLGAALLWMSNGDILPFFPYAISSLILPAVLFTWRGGVLAAFVFIIFDITGLALFHPYILESPAMVGIHTFTPLFFVGLWVGIQGGVERVVAAPLDGEPSEYTRFSRQWNKEAEYYPEVEPFSFIKGRSSLDTEEVAEPQFYPTRSTWRVMPSEAYIVAQQGEEDLRRMIYELTPESDVGLADALKRLVKDFSRRSSINVTMTLKGYARELQPVQYITLFRLAQEALLNIQQHSQARSGWLTLSYEKHIISLTIRDDGVGLLDGTYERAGMHALRAMHYRFAEVDGYLEVFEQDKGVTIRGTVPVK
jgi:glucose-6-phosphate-specific signal transduction histidine kinase